MESSTRRPPRSQHRNVRCLAVSPHLVSSSGLTFCLFLSHLIESSADCQLLLQWVQAQLDDATIFPTEQDVPFPQDFREIVGNLFRRLFRVYAHVYHSHMERVVELSFEAHLNSCFKHFLYFVLEFKLVRSEELRPLQTLIERMTSEDDKKYGRESTLRTQGELAAVR